MNQPQVYRSPLPIIYNYLKNGIIQSNSLSFQNIVWVTQVSHQQWEQEFKAYTERGYEIDLPEGCWQFGLEVVETMN